MRVLLHHSDIADPPVGIWWEDEAGGEVRSYYVPTAGAEQVIGTQIMSQKAEDASWQDYFDFLEEGAPFVNGWESAEVLEPPEVFLTRMNKMTRTA